MDILQIKAFRILYKTFNHSHNFVYIDSSKYIESIQKWLLNLNMSLRIWYYIMPSSP